jgi:hypothetical protein
MWDEFFSALDGLTVRIGAGPGDVRSHRRDLDAMRTSYGELLARDLVGSDACERAALRLDNLAAVVTEPAVVEQPPRRQTRHSVHVDAGWMLDDGTARFVLTLQPTPSLAWERGFVEFERAVYLSAGSRPKVRHATVQLACPPPDVAAAVDSLQGRVDTYRCALAD